jgi:hypothetical protein
MVSYLRTPGQASQNFGLGSANAIRPKGLFFVRFRRPEDQREGGDAILGNDFGFVVKSLDQPKIAIKTEEVNQYNKKRHIHTSYDVSPITITLFDTMIGTARRLWHDYLRYHFGDFNHSVDSNKWTTDQLLDSGSDTNFGFQLPPDGSPEDSRYYFHSIDIIQVYGGYFTKAVMVNPRILSFDPDDLDYEQMSPSTFRMQVTSETILFEDMAPLEQDSELLELFGEPGLAGNPIDLPDQAAPPSNWSSQRAPFGTGDGAPFVNGGGPISLPNIFGSILGGSRVGSGGVLGSMGDINFGNLAASAVERLIGGRKGNLASELVYAGTNNPALAGIVQMIEGPNSTARVISQGVGMLQRSNPTANPVVYDAARALIASQTGNKQGAASLAGNLARSIVTAGMATGGAPGDHVQQSSSGMSLSSASLGLANMARSATAFIGKRTPPGGRS